jgi:hypothetical protein
MELINSCVLAFRALSTVAVVVGCLGLTCESRHSCVPLIANNKFNSLSSFPATRLVELRRTLQLSRRRSLQSCWMNGYLLHP